MQETKLQEGQGEALGTLVPGYEAYWNYSTVKKGYSGSAVLLKTGIKGGPREREREREREMCKSV